MSDKVQLIAEQLAELINNDPPALEDALAAIDPRDSESAFLLYDWLRKNGRLHKIGTLEQGISGYLLVYQEPPGSTNEGWTDGGTQGDRAVDSALETAQEAGAPAIRGLCRKCLSLVSQTGSNPPVAEAVAEGQDPAVCKGGHHELAT